MLRRTLRIASREGFTVIVPSLFEDLIVRTKRGGRALSADEQKAVLDVYPNWLARLAEFATETCLSHGDLLRLTDDMVDRRQGVIIPEGGRKKTGADQIAPLTPKARRILDEIKAGRRSGAIVPDVVGLIFTRDDGSRITKGMIDYQVERAIELTKVKKFVFHNYRNTALTEWARRGIDVDHAMMASGHTSVQMHKHYMKLQAHDIAAAFGTAGAESENVTENATDNREASAR